MHVLKYFFLFHLNNREGAKCSGEKKKQACYQPQVSPGKRHVDRSVVLGD